MNVQFLILFSFVFLYAIGATVRCTKLRADIKQARASCSIKLSQAIERERQACEKKIVKIEKRMNRKEGNDEVKDKPSRKSK